jgi:hypothetical protein
MKSFTTAMEDAVSEAEGKVEEKTTPFEIDGRELRAYAPTEGQLAFMLASMGRGQTTDQRFASIVNLMLESLREGDKDYLESRLLSRDPRKRLPIKMVEEIFTYLMEEWFARPTQPQSGSAPSPQSDGQN